MRINEVDNPLSQTELDQLEVFADRLFAKVGIDVEFTRHFLDRVNDERNVKQITASELTRLFKQEYKKWGKPIAELGPDAEAVLKDLATDVNLPFALRWDSANNELDLIAKTVMRKKNFKTSNKEFAIQSHDYSLDNTQHKLVHESIQALSERKQLNEFAIAVPAIGIGMFEAYCLAVFGLTATAVIIDIADRPEAYSWIFRNMAASYTATKELIFGKDEVDAEEVKVADSQLQSSVAELVIKDGETLDNEAEVEAHEETVEVLDSTEEALEYAYEMVTQGVHKDEVATDIVNKVNNSGLSASEQQLIANAVMAATVATDTELSSKIEVASNADGANSAGVTFTSQANAAGNTVDTTAADAQNKASDAKLIALGQQIAQQRKADAQNATSDAKLIALGQEIAQQKKADSQNKISDAKLIALGQAYAQAQADAKANAQNKASDAKLIALGQAYAQAQADAKADAQNKAADDKLIKTAQTVAMQKAADAKADAQNTAADDKLIKTAQAVAMQKAADAKADAQNTAADDKLIKTAQAVAMQKAAAIQARKDHDEYQNKKINTISTASDAAAKYAKQNKIADAGLIKLATNAAEKAATDAYNNSNEISDNKLKQLAIAAAAAEIDKENNKTKSTAVDVTYPTDVHPDNTKKNDVKIAPITYPIDHHPDISKVNTNVNTDIKTHAATNTNKTNTTKTKTGKRHWPFGGDDSLWPTNLYKWTQKYGTFENENLITKYFTLNEGGAMPGVGTVHISEIQPTLEQLEKSLGINLQDNTLGSVGKKQFSGDIDVALKIAPEEIPAFIEALTKNPLVSDIRKTSVVMTKVKIQNFDKSKEDPEGRPRTGFVQVDFMPGDPGWLKTYYHTPHEDDSKYKGVFRNIMIATLAAVHNRDESDAKLEDGRAMETRRLMWSPTEGLLRVKRTPVPNKAGTGYTKKNKNETIDGPWKQPDDIAQQLGLDSGKDLNSFESLLKAMQKNWTKEAQQYAVDGFKDNKVIQDIGIPEELQ